MRLRRRSLRKGLVLVGCLVAVVPPFGSISSSPTAAWRLAATAVLLLLGSLLHLWSKGCLEQNQRLVTAGPYRFTRNPFYLANLLIDLGLCALIGRTWVTLPYGVLWVLAYRETIRREEARLAQLFPAAFERYVAAVPRLIPTGRGLPRGEAAGRFTLENPALSQGSEYARIFGVWLAAAAIVGAAWLRARGLSAFDAEHATGLGLVVLLAMAWAVKLALAEVFRRPQTALLPCAGEPARRRIFTAVLVLGLYLVAQRFGPGSSFSPARSDSPLASLAGSVALGLCFGLILALPWAKTSHGLRGLLHAGLFVALAVFAASRELLWSASLPLLWVALALLDDLAVARLQVRLRARGSVADAPPLDRPLWPMFRPVAILAAAGTALLVALRSLV